MEKHEAAAEITRLRSLLAEAVKVVEPFGLAGGTLSSRWGDDDEDWQHGLYYSVNVGHLRAAHSLLFKLKGEGQ